MQIKRALGIMGVTTTQSAWSLRGDVDTEGTQIDLLIERNDNIVNMCEMKFFSEEFAIDKNYHAKLAHRQNVLLDYVDKRTAIHTTLVTTYGLKNNEYSGDFTNVVTLEQLFE